MARVSATVDSAGLDRAGRRRARPPGRRAPASSARSSAGAAGVEELAAITSSSAVDLELVRAGLDASPRPTRPSEPGIERIPFPRPPRPSWPAPARTAALPVGPPGPIRGSGARRAPDPEPSTPPPSLAGRPAPDRHRELGRDRGGGIEGHAELVELVHQVAGVEQLAGGRRPKTPAPAGLGDLVAGLDNRTSGSLLVPAERAAAACRRGAPWWLGPLSCDAGGVDFHLTSPRACAKMWGNARMGG